METSLHIAAREGHVEIVKNLLAVAARVEQLKQLERSEDTGKTDIPLYGSGNEQVQKNLDSLDSLAEVTVDLMAPTASEYHTPLHVAAIAGHVEVVLLIIDFMRTFYTGDGSGSDRHVDVGLSPQSPSSSKSDPDRGTVSAKKSKVVPRIDQLTMRGKTAFHEAARCGHIEVMRVLLEGGADINAYMRAGLDITINTDLTALVQACLMNKLDIVRFLLQNGATDARLKALTRSLRVPLNDVVGLLLCYNGGVQLDTNLAHTKTGSQTAMLSVAWNSKKLSYIYESWLQTVCMEFPVPGNRTRVISQVNISSNELSNLPVALFQLKHLTRIDVSRNKITDLPFFPDDPHKAWNCPRLSKLDISNNKLTSLPSLLFSLQELKEINANSNDISEIDMSVWTARRLRRLFLSHNHLQAFPTSESALTAPTVSPLIPISNTEPIWESVYQSEQPPSLRVGVGLFSRNSLQAPSCESGYQSGQPPSRRMGMGLFSRSSVQAPSCESGYQSGQPPSQRVGVGFCIGWSVKNYQDTKFELDNLDDIETEASDEQIETSPLEHLDLSHNQLTSVPQGLSCLASKLQKLNLSNNHIRSLGHLNDYPPYLELIDASHNELSEAIKEPVIYNYASCARRKLPNVSSSVLVKNTASPLASYKLCSHRLHKNLLKLSTVQLNHNRLVDVQLFRKVSRNRSGDLMPSIKESKHKGHSSNSSRSADSQQDSSVQSPTSAIFSPLYPMLSTLDVAHNKLHSVPHNIHLVSTLAHLVLSHNLIESLPLELCNLDHLWTLKYEGCNLISPPKEDLDKFHLVGDKLLYMKSLLYE